MNTKLLKQKILDLAIRGKLTQQLKSDGNTADLLKEISSACHPERSAKGAKSKDPGTIIPLDKSETPFEIPANWEWVRLGDLCKASSGKTPSTSQKEFWNGNVLWVTSKDVKQKYIDSTQICLSDLGASSMQLYPPKTMIIVGRSGILRHSLPVAILKKNATVNQDLKALVFKDDRIVEFIYAVIKGMEQHLLHEYKKAGTTVDNLNFDLFLTAPIPLPPLAEQQRIVAKIEEAFAEIDAIEKNKELLKTHIKQTRQKILDLAIHGKLVPQNKSDEPASVLLERITRDNPHYEKLTDIPFEIPESWEWIKLMNVCEDFIVPQRDKPTEFTGNIPWCRIEDIEGKYLNGSRSHQLVTKELADKMNMHLCPKGTVISACSASIGNQAITTVDCYTNQTFIGIVCNKTLLFNEYLYYFLESQSKKLKEMGKGTTIGYISRKKYEDYAFPLPPLAEQKRIVNKIEEIFASLNEISLHLV